jgi:hypothetical protein
MTTVHPEKLVVVIEDNAPAERREWIINALADMLRHYALNPNKRFEDHESAAQVADLIKELNEIT